MNYEQKNPTSIKFLFNKIAKNYDFINIMMSFGLQKIIKEKAVKYTLKKLGFAPENILDLCTGTGDIAVLFEKSSPKSKITAVDFSGEMLNIARTRSNKIEFLECDINDFNTLPKEKFDICFIGFGLRNLPDIDNFLEMLLPTSFL